MEEGRHGAGSLLLLPRYLLAAGLAPSLYRVQGCLGVELFVGCSPDVPCSLPPSTLRPASMSSLPRNPNPNPPDGETSVNIYGYTPWIALCIFSVAFFGVALFVHAGYAVYAARRRKKLSTASFDDQQETKHLDAEPDGSLNGGVATFEVLFSVGCALEVVGYAFRTASSRNPFVLTSFILNYFMIVVAPVFFSASQYYCLSLLLQRHLSYAELLPLSGKAIIAIFVTADLVTIVMQIAGAALVGVAESDRASGKVPPLTPTQANDILRAGLAVQVFSITIFLLLLSVLLYKVARRGLINAASPDAWRRRAVLAVLAFSTFFIYLRTVFRLAEAASGVTSGISLNQPLFVALETVPVFVAVLLWTVLPLHVLLR